MAGMGGGYTKKLTFDNLSGCPVGIDFNEHVQHTGYQFRMCTVQSLSNAEVAYFTLTTPALPWICHMIFKITLTSEQTVAIFEGPTVTPATGTPFAPRCKNRWLDRTAKVTGLIRPTVTDTGLQLLAGRATAGRGAASVQAQDEWLLAPATTYAVQVTAHAAGYITMAFEWQEHRPESDPSVQPSGH